MPRTVVPHPSTPYTSRGTSTQQTGSATNSKPDDFPEKLVKYVPAETLAFFVPATALIGETRKELLVFTVVVAAIGTYGYLWLRARPLPLTSRPRGYSYLLSEVAFVCWAVAVRPNVAALVGLDQAAAGLILLAAVFLVPLADSVLDAMYAARK